MEKEKTLMGFYEAAEDASRKVVQCNGCTQCCERGFIYVLPSEKERLKKLDVPLLKLGEGLTLISPKMTHPHQGGCSMLDAKGHCSIYINRPLSCRLYPFDVMSKFRTQRQATWGMYSSCPTDRLANLVSEKNGQGNIHLSWWIIMFIVIPLDRAVPSEILEELIAEDKASSEIEMLFEDRESWQEISPITAYIENSRR